MKTMTLNFRNILGAATVASMLFLGAATFTSCGKQGCTDLNATNYDVDADEDDGSCAYVTDKFVGTYIVNELCNPGNINTTNISFTVTQSADKVTIVTTNFGNFNNVQLTGTVSGNVITLDTPQSFTIDGDTYAIIAPATIILGDNGVSVSISYNYSVTIDGDTTNFTCTANGSKQ